jgi:hypothetical protein
LFSERLKFDVGAPHHEAAKRALATTEEAA